MKPENKEAQMPILKFNEGDDVKISQSAPEHGGKTGEIVKYLGLVAMQIFGQSSETGGTDPWWDVSLQDTGDVAQIQESYLTPA